MGTSLPSLFWLRASCIELHLRFFLNRPRYRPDASLQIFLEHIPEHLTDSVHSRKYRIT